MSVFFNGRKLITPQSASMLDDSAMFNKNSSSGNTLALIGRANGGKPLTVLTFQSANEARAVLKGDDVTIKAIEKAFSGSNQVNGPAQVKFIRVNPATQSTLTLKDGSANNVITLTSSDYGLSTNQIKVKVESGSSSGKKLTTQLGAAYYSQDNVARNALDVTYSGSGAGTITVSETQVSLSGNSVVTNIDLATYPTVQELVDRINTVSGFAANVRDGNGEKPSLKGLDAFTAADCKTSTLVITANLQACVDWFNGLAEGFVDAVRVTGAGTVPTNIAYTYLSGGSDGTVTNTEWQSAFDLLQQEDVQKITPLSSSAAIHAMADTHVQFMSANTKYKRRAYCGDGTGVTDSTALTNAAALNSDRTSYTHIGAYDYNQSGTLTLYPAYVVAASLAGCAAGSDPGESLTNKSLTWRGMERKLRNPVDTDVLIEGGVLCVESTNEGIKVVKDISTWLINDNFNRVEQATGAACDFTLRSVQEILDELRGKGATPRTLAEALSRADTKLKDLSRPKPFGPGVLVGDENNPAYRKLQGSIDGDVIRVSYECSPVIPANFILQTASAVPYSGSASA